MRLLERLWNKMGWCWHYGKCWRIKRQNIIGIEYECTKCGDTVIETI